MASTQNSPHFFALVFLASIAFLLNGSHLSAQEKKSPDKPAEKNAVDLNFKAYFASETAKLAERCLNDLTTLDEWKTRRVELRRQLFDMLGLDPLPEKTDLKPVITKTVEGDGFKVECLHFQSRPGLYVTGNLYIPDEVDEKLPAILYVCGHGGVKKNGISYGNKVHYQHHGAWFARNGYVCLTIDSLQLGEIEGIHHGTYKYNMWWWINRGYTPAGVEAWNCIRALDYLATRPEVDMEKIGVTGRSGGGAYSWWIAALDERIKVAVPVAGITDLQNHVVDGCVEGHCDCMFFNNTFRWDYPMVAALVAPRPLLISNTDRDRIFPLDGVYRTYKKVRKVYELYEKPEDVALHITAGPHKDTQELRIHAFRWFNHYLKGTDDPIRLTADKFFEPEQLRVFNELPEDSINAKIHETFVAEAVTPQVPKTPDEWRTMSDGVKKQLRENSFGGWPESESDLNLKRTREKKVGDILFEEYQFDSQSNVRLTMYLARTEEQSKIKSVEMLIKANEVDYGDSLPVPYYSAEDFFLDEASPRFRFAAESLKSLSNRNETVTGSVFVFFRPRGFSHVPQAEPAKELVPLQVRRRYALLGQSLDGMRVYDVRRAIQATRKILGNEELPVSIDMEGKQVSGAFAALFEANVSAVLIPPSPQWKEAWPVLLNSSRFVTPPMLTAMLGDQTKVRLFANMKRGLEGDENPGYWKFPLAVDRLLDRESFVPATDE